MHGSGFLGTTVRFWLGLKCSTIWWAPPAWAVYMLQMYKLIQFKLLATSNSKFCEDHANTCHWDFHLDIGTLFRMMREALRNWSSTRVNVLHISNVRSGIADRWWAIGTDCHRHSYTICLVAPWKRNDKLSQAFRTSGASRCKGARMHKRFLNNNNAERSNRVYQYFPS